MPEVLVNTTTAGAQTNPQIAALSDGGWVVTWVDLNIVDIFQQRFSADGTPVGSEIVVNTTTADRQVDPDVVALEDGGWVVTWSSLNPENGFWDTWQKRYDSTGIETGAETLVNTFTDGRQDQSVATALPDGGWVVTWMSRDQDGHYCGIYQQRFGADGAAVGLETEVNQTGESRINQHISTLADGGWIVSWSSSNQDGTGFRINFQRYAANGTEVGGEVQANTFTESYLGVMTESFVTGLADGGWIVTWTSSGQDTLYSDGIFMQRYDADGSAVGEERQVNTYAMGSQENSSILALPDGGWLVFWNSDLPAGYSDAANIVVQRFLSNGVAIGAEFQVNAELDWRHIRPEAVLLDDGSIVVTWQRSGPGGSGRPVPGDIVQTILYATPIVSGSDSSETVQALANSSIVLAFGGDDSVLGQSGNDTLRGDVGNDTLQGGLGGDVLDGGADIDTAVYSDSDVGLVVDMLTPANNTGIAAGDVFVSVENLAGSNYSDTLRGDNLGNMILGNGGSDQIDGAGGSDTVLGGAGNDTLTGGLGSDHLWGGLAADHHIGGDDAGADYARYDDANYGNLMIRLDNSALNSGAAAVGDTYSGIEGLVGGAGNDTVIGDGLGNFLLGSGGTDLIYGGSGNDLLSGDAGGDNLWGGVGADAHYGGNEAGIDYARYDDANHGNLTLRLDNAALNAGAAALGDTYTGIEGLVGGAGDDVIIGNTGANYLFGQGGTDYIDGLAGSDHLNGGAGADRFRFSTALSGSNVDHIADFQHLVDDILLLQSVFAGIGPALTVDEFRIGMAQDTNDRILYNNITGQLYYDSNANVAAGMMLFATVTAGTVLTFDDFIMV